MNGMESGNIIKPFTTREALKEKRFGLYRSSLKQENIIYKLGQNFAGA